MEIRSIYTHYDFSSIVPENKNLYAKCELWKV